MVIREISKFEFSPRVYIIDMSVAISADSPVNFARIAAGFNAGKGYNGHTAITAWLTGGGDSHVHTCTGDWLDALTPIAATAPAGNCLEAATAEIHWVIYLLCLQTKFFLNDDYCDLICSVNRRRDNTHVVPRVIKNKSLRVMFRLVIDEAAFDESGLYVECGTRGGIDTTCVYISLVPTVVFGSNDFAMTTRGYLAHILVYAMNEVPTIMAFTIRSARDNSYLVSFWVSARDCVASLREEFPRICEVVLSVWDKEK